MTKRKLPNTYREVQWETYPDGRPKRPAQTYSALPLAADEPTKPRRSNRTTYLFIAFILLALAVALFAVAPLILGGM